MDTKKSASGYVFKLSNGPVSWCSQKKSTVSTYTTEAEYIAVKEIVWLRQLLQDVSESKLSDEKCYLLSLLIIQVKIKLIKNFVFHKSTKRIDV